MRKIELEELKKIQIEILDYVDSFCKKNNIKYWIDSGTLIGAVRHNGYIPWDDDIDIGMLRKDYNLFLSTFNIDNDNYKVYSIENNEDSLFPYAKVYKENTLIFEPNKKDGYGIPINIDLFIYDNAPDDDKLVEKMMKKRKFLRRLRNDKLFYKIYLRNMKKEKFSFRNVFKYIFINLSRLFSLKWILKKIVSNSMKYSNIKTLRVGNFTGCNKFIFKIDSVSKTILHKFENKKYPIPIGYDDLLTAQYGDYMKLPPIEKRVSHHEFEAFVLEDKNV